MPTIIDAATLVTPASPATGIDAGLAELFEEFRAAEEDDAGEEDFETHYNMGTAYKEMDLMDEAVQEFQTSAEFSETERRHVAFSPMLQYAGSLFHAERHAGSSGDLVQERLVCAGTYRRRVSGAAL